MYTICMVYRTRASEGKQLGPDQEHLPWAPNPKRCRPKNYYFQSTVILWIELQTSKLTRHHYNGFWPQTQVFSPTVCYFRCKQIICCFSFVEKKKNWQIKMSITIYFFDSGIGRRGRIQINNLKCDW